ncbi:Gfo/Idh/MocA family oxidoreductase [Cryobacterium glaciale]|uniref:Gfo/Idh/MocA family oxidoreductase n=2 Tax=Cryobacterium glaciale TaxID=1259145 RepID=A0A4R8URP8_9MICO|nr:Gfo/Idh/MocA family oxidoreductase [Cryobacterium glaciale]
MTTDVTDNAAGRPRIGIIGGGLIATVHSRAARAAGAELAGIASSSAKTAEAARLRLSISTAYPSVDAMLSDESIDVIHICTPNASHPEFALAALEAGKDVICEKPLATSASSAYELMVRAERLSRIVSVPFVYRFHAMVREARARVLAGAVGRIFVIQASYLQDWLLSSDDDDWRVETAIGGPSRAFADIGSHLCDLIEFVTDDRISRLNAVMRTVHRDRNRSKSIDTEDAVALVFETTSGVLGTILVSQVSAGRKNRLSFEISGERESLFFDQENPETLWLGKRTGFHHIVRDAATLHPSAARYSIVPPGHAQGYQDAFNAFVSDSYQARTGETPDGLPTFADGYRAAVLTEAVLKSHETGGWVDTPHSAAAIELVNVARRS